MKRFTSTRQVTGELGEDIACRWLVKKGFVVVERNVSCRFGEVDIVAESRGKLHFCEVKTIRRRKDNDDTYNPGDNITKQKIYRCLRTIDEYFLTHDRKTFQVDAILVYLDPTQRVAHIQYLEHITIL